MFNIFALLPLLFFLISTFIFNRKKLNQMLGRLLLLTFFEAVFSYCIVYLFFLEGFVSFPYQFFLIILSLLVTGMFLTKHALDTHDQFDLQIETIKNNIILFLTTLLPMYILLTIFRFQPLILQIFYSVIITGIIFCLSILAKKVFDKVVNKVLPLITETYLSKYIILWIAIIVIAITTVLIDLPTNSVRRALNLSDNINYAKYDGFPVNLNNRFKLKNIELIDLGYDIETKVTDYYYDDTHLYLYTEDTSLIIYDLVNEKVLNDIQLGSKSHILEEKELFNKFTYYDNQLILLGFEGLYLVTPTGATRISNLNCINTYKFYQDDQLYYLHKQSSDIYELYQVQNEELKLKETINLERKSFTNLVVISEHLFYQDEKHYYLYNDITQMFKIELGFPIYDEKEETMYFTLNNTFPEYSQQDTIYNKVNSFGQHLTQESFKFHNSKAIVIDDYIYYTEKSVDKLNRVEVMNHDFKFDSIHNHLELQPFWITKHYDKTYIANYQEKDNHLEFLQAHHNDKHTVIRIQQLQEKDLGMNLPFYSHYGILYIIIIGFAVFIPITNYRNHISVVSYETEIENKRKNNDK